MAKVKTFQIGLERKAKHGPLLAALEKRGWNQRQGAEFLGVAQTSFGDLINLKRVPRDASEELVIKLFELTGQSLQELWPKEVFTEKFLAAPKRLRSIRNIPVHLLAGAGILPALAPPTPEEFYQKSELREALQEAMDSLSPRYYRILHGRYIEGKTLEEMADELGVRRARAGQIELSALRRLRSSSSPETERLRKIMGS